MASRTPETTKEWLEYYEKRQSKFYRMYQETGDPKYDREQYKFGCICDAFQAKLEMEGEREADIRKRLKNKDWIVNNLAKNEYSKDEVIKLLNDAVYW